MILFYNNNRQGLRCLSVSELSESESKNGTLNYHSFYTVTFYKPPELLENM